ncbi:energy transducer TonB [Phenylobacterium sp. J426]|uniref:energy transducer TonB n=1 Tax=Phenylobacterium sp. J426 TaxID=2898439 RepID=UPI0021516D6E|nr:energy transducer TonB [Phenylobacterium sp. J426]MCR5876398.1 energy transducer TonB [Phenylobacterium sp. J426]
MARRYPDRAARDGLSGAAVMVCRVDAQGGLGDCGITEVDPKEHGFGEATLRLSALFKMRQSTDDGAPTLGRLVRIPVRWMLSPSSERALTVRYGGQVGRAQVSCRSRAGRLDQCIPISADPETPDLLAAAHDVAVQVDASAARIAPGPVTLHITFAP